MKVAVPDGDLCVLTPTRGKQKALERSSSLFFFGWRYEEFSPSSCSPNNSLTGSSNTLGSSTMRLQVAKRTRSAKSILIPTPAASNSCCVNERKIPWRLPSFQARQELQLSYNKGKSISLILYCFINSGAFSQYSCSLPINSLFARIKL